MKRVWVGLMLAAAAMGQTTPSKEYIYLNGRLVAVETAVGAVAPTITSVTPASGSGGSGTFTAVYSDGNGGSDIAKGELQVLPSGAAVNGCVVRFVKLTGVLELDNDAGNGVAGTVTVGGTGSVSNSRCTLNAAGSSATVSGQILTVVFPLVYAAGFAGAKDLKLYAADAAGLTAGPTAMGVWTVPDTTAPVISGAGATATNTTATITWTTNEGATSQVEYGTTTAYGSASALDSTLVTSHSVTLTGLQATTLYYLRLQSKDAAGNAATPVLLQVTTAAAPTCSLTPVSGTVANAGGSVAVTVNCAAGLGWTSAVNGGVNWVTVTPASGTGPGTATVTAANAGGGAQRTATATIAGQTFTLTQRGASTVSVTPASASAAHDQTVAFSAVVDGVSNNCAVTWTLTPVVGTISNCGVYLAPSVILSTQTAVTVTAVDPVNNGSASAALTLTPYAPPGTLSVNPSSGTAASATLTFSVTDAGGAASVTDVQMLVHTTNGDAVNACYVRVRPGSVEMPANAVYLGVNSATDWYGPTGAGTAGAVLANSQCSLNVASTTVTLAGNTVSIAIPFTFKPGFTGVKNIYMKATNSSGAQTYWLPVGTRDLTGNAAALPPTLTVSTPTPGATVSGTVNVTGWALDNATQSENLITSVEVYVDDVFKGYSTMGHGGTNACTLYPGRPGCPYVGFLYALNTGLLTNGTHTLKVIARDFDTVPKLSPPTSFTITVSNTVSQVVVVSPADSFARMVYNNGTMPVDTKQFTATVGGTASTAVNWSVSAAAPNNAGSISTAGLYTPPDVYSSAVGTNVTVTATSQANLNNAGTTKITLMGVMSPAEVSLPANHSALFSASGLGSVTFALSPNVGSITATGYYTAPGSYTPGTIVTVTATSTENPAYRQQGIVRLQ